MIILPRVNYFYEEFYEIQLAYKDIKLAHQLEPENKEVITYYNKIVSLVKKYINDQKKIKGFLNKKVQ